MYLSRLALALATAAACVKATAIVPRADSPPTLEGSGFAVTINKTVAPQPDAGNPGDDFGFFYVSDMTAVCPTILNTFAFGSTITILRPGEVTIAPLSTGRVTWSANAGVTFSDQTIFFTTSQTGSQCWKFTDANTPATLSFSD